MFGVFLWNVIMLSRQHRQSCLVLRTQSIVVAKRRFYIRHTDQVKCVT